MREVLLGISIYDVGRRSLSLSNSQANHPLAPHTAKCIELSSPYFHLFSHMSVNDRLTHWRATTSSLLSSCSDNRVILNLILDSVFTTKSIFRFMLVNALKSEKRRNEQKWSSNANKKTSLFLKMLIQLKVLRGKKGTKHLKNSRWVKNKLCCLLSVINAVQLW